MSEFFTEPTTLGTVLIKAQGLCEPEVRHAFSTRVGGASSGPFSSLNLGLSVGDAPGLVAENRARLVEALGMRDGVLVTASQVHGDRAAVIKSAESVTAVHPGEADALITNTPGLLLAVLVADCVPVLLYDRRRRAVGAVHAGWKGTASRITAKAVAAMGREFGSAPEDIQVAVGPSIGPCCYEIDTPVHEAFLHAWPASEAHFHGGRPGRWHLDLWGLQRLALQEMGVPAENVRVSGYCTVCHQDLFFSHRGSGGKTGRMAGAIGLTRAGE